MVRRALLLYGAGSFSAFFQSLIAFALGDAGFYAYANSTLTPGISETALAHKMMWGGIFAVIGIFPMIKKASPVGGILLLSMAPSIAQLLYFMPQSGAGWFGLHLGWSTPLILITLNLLWSGLTLLFAGKV
jgi:hypothetical protein